MLQHAALRRPRVIGTRDQIAVDRPGRGLVELVAYPARVGAGKAEADREVAAAVVKLGACQRDLLLELGAVQGEALAGGGREDQSVDGPVGIMAHEAAQ